MDTDVRERGGKRPRPTVPCSQACVVGVRSKEALKASGVHSSVAFAAAWCALRYYARGRSNTGLGACCALHPLCSRRQCSSFWVDSKQNIAFDPHELAKVFERCTTDSTDVAVSFIELCDAWNTMDDPPWLWNVARTELHQLKLVASEPIWEVEAAHSKLEQTRRDGVHQLVCAVQCERHRRLAVVLDLPYRRAKPSMSAIDVQGPSMQATMDVTSENFGYAVAIDALIVGWKADGGTPRQQMPPFTTAYEEMVEARAEVAAAAPSVGDHNGETAETELVQGGLRHHPASGEDLSTLQTLATQYPDRFIGLGGRGKNGKPSSSGWRFVREERQAGRSTKFRADDANGNRVGCGTLLECVLLTLS